ncbi:hypothetical protein [Kozakia baliensis]|uniref:hypothetical protein n=1 Tax=Kozakia baliensis TaxID=153496 RepID=UPI0011DFF368|nr:hypothetical protein [Kozakia baliensis]
MNGFIQALQLPFGKFVPSIDLHDASVLQAPLPLSQAFSLYDVTLMTFSKSVVQSWKYNVLSKSVEMLTKLQCDVESAIGAVLKRHLHQRNDFTNCHLRKRWLKGSLFGHHNDAPS